MSFELHERKHIDDEFRKISRRQLRRAGEALVEAYRRPRSVAA